MEASESTLLRLNQTNKNKTLRHTGEVGLCETTQEQTPRVTFPALVFRLPAYTSCPSHRILAVSQQTSSLTWTVILLPHNNLAAAAMMQLC